MRDCMMGYEATPGCQLYPAAVGSGLGGHSLDFLIKNHENGWYQIVGSTRTSAQVWISSMTNTGFDFSVKSISEWLGAYRIQKKGSLSLRSKPTDDASVITMCKFSDTDPNAPIRFVSNINLEQDWVEGNWLKGSCQRPDCFAEDEPESQCFMPSRDRGVPICPVGWTKWLSEDGKLLLFPSYINCD